ncbi:alpha/beta hydrolase [Noviherbaspirillum sedimenti]|uniref:Alpha/beta hydrolase n=1 Tax=Noviherbaspirillum sedimenti TaxID=2320865 RepID=A0A3A3FX77_9BURK|nr:alpha/beta hydrolase [Noviherbaspirillum sedimenti]RJG00813.1 alpha/beta hydrolase [Noviherbaspirillum sedimenti]
MQRFHLILETLVLVTTAASALATESEDFEESVCGSIQEPFVFWMWSSAAGKPNPDAASRIPNAEPIVHKTKDGRLLKGYKLRSTATGGAVIGSVLVAQGNAMLADQLLSSLTSFSQAGIEAYVFDYRGYGNSEGARRLKAIVSDYREIFDRVGASTQGQRFLYGISFGGVVLLNVVGSGIAFDRAVIDSTPSRVSNLGCPEKYDPVINFPKDGSQLLLVAGEQDKVVPIKNSQELIDLAKTRGSRTEVRPDYAHPFMDSDIRIHRARLELIRSFLARTENGDAR